MTNSKRLKGISLIWTMATMIVLCVMCAMGVDWGRVQVAKTELRRAADSAARAGAANLGGDPAIVRSMTASYALKNKVDGQFLVLDTTTDIELGKWNSATKVFTKYTGTDQYSANAVRVIARKLAARSTAVPAGMSALLGRSSFDLTVESIAMLVPPINVDQDILATANPFLAGMPKGTVASLYNPHNSPDYAGDLANPRQSPQQIQMALVEDSTLNFDSIEGTIRHDPDMGDFTADGELTDIGTNTRGSENGISDLRAPINALVGIFLDDSQPNLTAAPEALDFSSPQSRDFSEMKPKLKQTFFIGDGLSSSGTKQSFIVPKGATRLFLASWDYFEWNNNSGHRDVKITRPGKIITVK